PDKKSRHFVETQGVDFYIVMAFRGIHMNYTKTIRNYCQQNEGHIFDSQQMFRDFFSMVPYKTFIKILNRLEDENILSSVSKGVYLFNPNNPAMQIQLF
nr:hypothetical protein [Clostridia bacterium]HOR90456.1 hypothetical protein [Clostridia bacterium]HPL08803.1 hypothetical protein [Clostridia bacterium]